MKPEKMNSGSLIPLVAAVFFVTGCGADRAVKDEKQQANNPSAAKEPGPANVSSSPNDDIVGEWEMVGFVVDTNDNLQIDEAERKDLKRTMKDYMKLNRDGSGTFTLAELPGRFEANDPQNSGKRVLAWYDKTNSQHRIGMIIRVTKEELHIKEPGGHGLFIWKRQ